MNLTSREGTKTQRFTKFLLFFIIILAVTSSLYAAGEELFSAGNSLYEQGKYNEAIKKYEELLNTGYASGELYYNIGNCYFKLGSLGKTILFYERAKRLTPADPELRFNLNYVYSLLEDKIKAPYRNWFLRKINSIIHLFNPGEWIGFTIIIWLALAITGIIAVFFVKSRRVFKYTAVLLTISLIIGIINSLILYTESTSAKAIILAKEVPVRYGPGEGEVEAFLLHEGTQVAVRARKKGWLQIHLPDGKTGWLPKSTVEEI